MRTDASALHVASAPAPAEGSPAVIPGLVWAFRIGADGRAESLPVDHPIDLSAAGLLWLHFNLADARALQWLGAELRVHATAHASALMLSRETYQQLHATPAGLYGVIADLKRTIVESTEEVGHLHFVLSENQLLSGRHHALCAVEATRRALENGLKVNSAAGLLENIVERIADTTQEIVDKIADALDDIEEAVLAGDMPDILQRLGQSRRQCIRIHRRISGLRLVLHRMEHNGVDDIKPTLRLRAGRLAQRLEGLDGVVVEMRERSRLLQEEHHLHLEEMGSNSLRVLSILSALLLPPTLVAGMFGMNAKLPLPETDSGFLWALLFIGLSSLSAFILMKRLGLIR